MMFPGKWNTSIHLKSYILIRTQLRALLPQKWRCFWPGRAHQTLKISLLSSVLYLHQSTNTGSLDLFRKVLNLFLYKLGFHLYFSLEPSTCNIQLRLVCVIIKSIHRLEGLNLHIL